MIWYDAISPDSIPKGSLQSKSDGGRRQKRSVKGKKVKDVLLNFEKPEHSQRLSESELISGE